MRKLSSLSLALTLAGFIACSGPNDSSSNAEAAADNGAEQVQEAAQAAPETSKAEPEEVKAGGAKTP